MSDCIGKLDTSIGGRLLWLDSLKAEAWDSLLDKIDGG